MSTVSPTAVVSSSSTLWATASKEWVIPAKPKPGRKPKKDTAPPLEDSAEADSKERRVQNRAAQRAFRERKQSQLAELQARVQQYEQGEVERNVALQQIAKKLKEENEALRSENSLLKEKVAQLTQSLAFHDLAKKRSRDELSSRSPDSSAGQYAKKKAKVTPDTSTYASSASSSASSPASNGTSHTSYSPVPSFSPQEDSTMSPLESIFDVSQNCKDNMFESTPLHTCGFCNESTPCVCRELALEHASEQMSLSSPQHEHNGSPSVYNVSSPVTTPAQPSILDNLPEYQPPVPLRRRSPNPNTTFNPVFPVSLASSGPQRMDVSSCSGDPSNCMACADDAFGKAFCAAISQTVASTSCGNCPNSEPRPSATGCCGNAAFCGQTGCGPSASGATLATASNAIANYPSETMPCDDAWRHLKSHPNVEFTDLSLLAEVVARRSKCNGPNVEIIPAPGSITPERGLSPRADAQGHAEARQLSDSRSQFQHTQQTHMNAPSPPPQLVPQDVLISCGRRYRVREVMTDGVRDALRLLDSKFSVP